MDIDLIRRGGARRGRVTVERTMTARQAAKNAILSAALAESGLQATASEELANADGDPYFIFGLTPMTDDYVI